MIHNLIKEIRVRKSTRVAALLITVIILASMVALSCGPATPTEEEPPETLKIGFNMALSGPAGGWGIPQARAIEMEMEKINDAGGIVVGGKTYLLELIKEDNEYDPEKAATAARKLVEVDKVKFIFGGLVTHDTLAIVPITTPAKVLTFGTFFGDKPLSNEVNAPYCFKISFVLPHEAYPAMYGYIFETYPEATRFAEIDPNTMSGIFGQELSINYLESLGKETVAAERFEFPITDFYPILARMLAEEPDVIHSGCVPTDLWITVIKQAREMGYTGIFMQEQPITDEAIAAIGVENAYKIISVERGAGIFGPLETPGWKSFYDRYVEKYGEWQGNAPDSIPVFHAFVEALQIAGTVEDTDKIKEVLESESFTVYGLTGEFGDGMGFYDQPHQWAYPAYIMEVKDGVNTVVAEISIEEQIGISYGR